MSEPDTALVGSAKMRSGPTRLHEEREDGHAKCGRTGLRRTSPSAFPEGTYEWCRLCRDGHPQQKLRDADVRRIRERVLEHGETQISVARDEGLAQGYVSDLVNGRARPSAGGPIQDLYEADELAFHSRNIRQVQEARA